MKEQNNANKYFEGLEEIKAFDIEDLELKKQKLIRQYNQYIKEVNEVDFTDALHALIAIKDVVSLKENDNYTFNTYPIWEYELNNKIIPYNIIYLCKENKEEEAVEEIKKRIVDGTVYEPNDNYIFLGSFIGEHLINKTITFNPKSKIKDNSQIKGMIFDGRFDYINEFMSRVTKFKLTGNYRNECDLYKLARLYARPERINPKKESRIRRLFLKRD